MNKLLDYQQDFYNFLDKEDLVVAKKFRNSGLTLTATLYLFHKLINCKNIVIGIFTINVPSILDSLKSFDKSNILKFRSCDIKCPETQSKIILTEFQPSCGVRLDYIWLDEIASAENPRNILASVLPCKKNKMFITSTICKKTNWFYQFYQESIEGLNKFKVFECNYTQNPFYQKFDINQLKDEIFKQEILGEFYT